MQSFFIFKKLSMWQIFLNYKIILLSSQDGFIERGFMYFKMFLFIYILFRSILSLKMSIESVFYTYVFNGNKLVIL